MPRPRTASWRQGAAMVAALAASLASGVAAARDLPGLEPLQGAWVVEGTNCGAVFFKQGTAIHFVRPGATARDGVLVKGDRVEDARNRCTISRVRADGARQAVLLTCFSGLLVSKVAISLRFAGEDTLIRTPSDFPDDELRLRRCRL